MRTSQRILEVITTIGLDLGKNTFHVVGLDKRSAIVLRQKVSRAQLERRLANIPPCLIGMEACSGSHHIGRKLSEQGHEVRLASAAPLSSPAQASPSMRGFTPSVTHGSWLRSCVRPAHEFMEAAHRSIGGAILMEERQFGLSWMSSTDFMKWVCPRIKFVVSRLSIRIVVSCMATSLRQCRLTFHISRET